MKDIIDFVVGVIIFIAVISLIAAILLMVVSIAGV